MHIHFIGIGGTAMGSVAIACSNLGHRVTGSDASVYPPMSTVLNESSIEWYQGYSQDKLAEIPAEVYVIGNAISRGNEELEHVLRNRLNYISMAELVGETLIDKNTSIVVSGTHGKTTTTSITAWILEHAGFRPGFMIGGVPRNFKTGCRVPVGDAHNSRAGVFVVEGDEYDTAFFDKRSKFVHYRPTVAIVNNLEFDHADIFASVEDIIRSFSHMVRIVPDNGLILVNGDEANALEAVKESYAPVQRVGFNSGSDWLIKEVGQSVTGSEFQLTYPDGKLHTFSLGMPGTHSMRNAAMALAATSFVGVTKEEQYEALLAYLPPKRRLEIIGGFEGATVIDDFAHHPTAISATISAVEKMYPSQKIHCVFEPRSNTTTRNFFQKELADCFEGAWTACIGPINRPERYAENELLNVKQLESDLLSRGIQPHTIDSTQANEPWGHAVAEILRGIVRSGDVILLLSNGNLGGFRDLVNKP